MNNMWDTDTETLGQDELQQAEQILSEIQEVDEEIDDAETGETSRSALSEADERLEKAILYRTLLNDSLFEEGSSDDELVSQVEEEVRMFVRRRLEHLLGMSKPTPERQAVQSKVELPFSEEQLEALKFLANRITQGSAEKKEAPKAEKKAPATKKAAPAPAKKLLAKKRPETPKTAKKKAPRPGPTARKKMAAAKRKLPPNTVEKKVVELPDGQKALLGTRKVSQTRPPKGAPRPAPMPSAEEEKAMHATQADLNSQGNQLLGVGDLASQIMKNAQKRVEESGEE